LPDMLPFSNNCAPPNDSLSIDRRANALADGTSVAACR